MNAPLRGKYTRLANLKQQIKKLETEAKSVQEWIFDHQEDPDFPLKKVNTGKDANLCLTCRDNWSKPNNEAAIDTIGMESFLKHASITKTGIAKAGGEKAVADMVNTDELRITSVTRFYSLKKSC